MTTTETNTTTTTTKSRTTRVTRTVGETLTAAEERSVETGSTVRLRWTQDREASLRARADEVVVYADGSVYASGGADADGTVFRPWSIALDRRPA